jgi:uncharacterized membrane protein YkvA (DUF1232 family)
LLVQLTNSDRRDLLDSFRTLAADRIGQNADLIIWATEWTASLAPTFGFELNLARDVFVLCETLRKAADGEAIRLARGGLAYLYRNHHVNSLTLGSLGLLDDAFVTGYAAHAIREKSGEAVCYCPPRLGLDEQTQAKAIFLDLRDRSEDNDEVLPELAEIVLGKLCHLLESGLFRRLRMNFRFLSCVLSDGDRSADHRQIARAALHYVAEEHAAIPNCLGLIGFLDDYFVADLAVGLINPDQSPWMNLIDAVVGAWPFLNMVTFGDGRKGTAVSEFLMVNSALACPVIRGSELHLTHLILPRTGPLPLLLGFFASLGELLSARGRQGSDASFEVGQKVLLDGKGGAYSFEGCKLINGQKRFGVGKTRKERGEILHSIQWLPIEQLNRLVPADPGRSVRGRLAVADLRTEPLGPLDYLFLAAEQVTFPANLPQVVVVTPVGSAKRTAESVSLFGHKLCDIVPMANLVASEDVCYWSGKFGSIRPAVLVVPDLDRACEYAEGEGNGVALTIVDASGPNAGRLAALSRLQGLGGRVLVAVAQADADGVLDDGLDSMVWEWGRTDFESVYVEPDFSTQDADLIRTYEREVVRAASAGVEVVPVHTPEVDEAFRSVTALKRLAEVRGEDAPQELEDALGRSFAVLTRLLRCPFRLSSHPRLQADLAAKLDALSECRASGVFLSGQEREAVAEAERRLRNLFVVLHQSNPKDDALAKLRLSCPELAVIGVDVELLDGADDLKARKLACVLNQLDGLQESGYAVAGWFSRDAMNRLLRPPFATPLYLLLYGPEISWHRAFTKRIREGWAARRVRTSRGRLFPSVGKWPDEPVSDPGEADEETPNTGVETPDAIETYLLSKRRNRLTSLATPPNGEESVETRLFTFDGGYAFLTHDYQAKLATHLMADATDDEEAKLEIVRASQLRCGDLLLFIRGSSRDVIRQVADQLLPQGVREQAGLWRRTLLKYQRIMDCPVEVVWRRLGKHGCPLSLNAVEKWFADENIISPNNVTREMGAILDLTRDPDLRDGLDACRDAVSRVRGAHLRASNQLARRVVERAVDGLKSAGHEGGTVDLGEGIVLARLTEIDETPLRVKASAVNRLVEESQWPE